MKYYKLDENGNPIECSSDEFLNYFKNQKMLRDEFIDNFGNIYVILTVFLGINQSSKDNEIAKVFKTVILFNSCADVFRISSTKQEALRDHEDAVQDCYSKATELGRSLMPIIIKNNNRLYF